MRSGVVVPADLAPSELVQFAVETEELGYDTLYHADERFFRDVYTLLGPVAGSTSTLRIGPLTVDPYSRHPAIHAMAIATLADMSGGRAILGIGPGSSGFRAVRIRRRRVVTYLREAIELIRLLLTSEENVTYQGETVEFINDRLGGFDTIPPVPIVIGTRGPRVLHLAGEIADGVVIGGYCSAPTIEWALGHIDGGVGAAQRDAGDLEVSVMVYASVDDDARRAYDAAKWGSLVALWSSLNLLGELPLGAEVPAELLSYMETTQKCFHPEVMGPGVALVPDSLLAPLSLAGTPDECAQKLAEIAGAGGGRVDRVLLLPKPVPGQSSIDVIRRFAREVLPEVAAPA